MWMPPRSQTGSLRDRSPSRTSCPPSHERSRSESRRDRRSYALRPPSEMAQEEDKRQSGEYTPTSTSSRTPSQAPSQGPSEALSPDATDRVFPIRSVVSVDPTATPPARSETMASDAQPRLDRRTSSYYQGSTGTMSPVETPPARARSSERRFSNSTNSDRRRWSLRESATTPLLGKGHLHDSIGEEPASPSIQGRNALSEAGSAAATTSDGSALVTARFQHVVTEEGHAIITGRGGETLQRCEDEPIHIPGAVQSFGLLIALHEISDGKLQVRVASENSKRIIGYTPQQLFELESFCDILTEEQSDNLLDHVDFIRDEDVDPVTNGPEVFTLAIRSPTGKNQKLWCAIHINHTNAGLVICEFELEDDPLYPLAPAGEQTPEPPEDTLNSEPSAEELAESTINASKPLRVLRSARKRKGEAAAMEVFNIMSQVQEQLSNAPSLEIFLKILVGVVKELTGFHRVMVYQFDAAWNGRVVTELVDPRATKDLYKGLNFPASDIPKQARDLYKVNKVRLLYDRDQMTSRLVCRTMEDLETPLDLTHAYLRAMSPIHIKYLANMAVRASMSISINAFGELWGLISCHTYGSKGMRVSFPIRKMCRLVGDSASQNIERLSYASRLHARKLINTVPTQTNPSGYIIASSDDLLSLFDADCGLLSIRDETKILGKLEHTQEALAMLEYLRLRKFTSVTKSTDIKFDFSDLRYPPGFTLIAGLLLVPLSVSGNDFIVFFRKGQQREVRWAGNPYEKFVKEGTEGYLEPRKSFKTWSETIIGKCRDWTEEQTETAAVLCLVYGKFIEVWRQKEAALQNSQLTRLLLSNSAHEVRTPLNAIINYLEIALEGHIDPETRDNLSRSYSASKSLVYVINDLLDLTKTEEGGPLIKDEIFDLHTTVREATDTFSNEAKRKGLDYQTIQHPGIPQYVVGDARRVRQAIANIVTNAIQYTTSGSVRVEMWRADMTQDRVDVDLIVEDTGCGIPARKLDALFRELEQVSSEDNEMLESTFSSTSKTLEDKEESKRTLGLGLAVVARIIRNMNGQMRLKSEEGKGSRFALQFVFDLPDEEDSKDTLQGSKAADTAPPADQPLTPPVEVGEVMLISKSAQKRDTDRPHEMVRRKSMDSVHSLNSMKSQRSISSAKSGKSDVDRLIEAIQEPAMANANDTEDSQTQNRRIKSATGSPLQSHGFPSRKSSGATPGSLHVADSKTPIRPIRMPGETTTGNVSSSFSSPIKGPRSPSTFLFDVPAQARETKESLTAERLQVLVAEDDPVNSKIIKKRLEKLGHQVHLTINGEECSSVFGQRPADFDVVLMDMQMPIVDGLTATKMIRSFEKSHANMLSKRATFNSRIPIFAVSASLVEKERQTYIDAGFDAWILKPIDIKRLSVLLNGIVQDDVRADCQYKAGHWEHGGWFGLRQTDIFSAQTAPSASAAVSSSPPASSRPRAKDDAGDEERSRLGSLKNDAVHASSLPNDPGTSGDATKSMETEGSTAPAS